MAKGVGGDPFGDARLDGSLPDGFLDAAVRDVVAANDTRTGIGGQSTGGECPLPDPFFACLGVFPFQSIGQKDRPKAFGGIFLVQFFDAPQVLPEGFDHRIGKHGNTILKAFAVTYQDLFARKINILNPQADCLGETKSTSV